MSINAKSISPKLSIWCEFMPYEKVIDVLPILAEYHCDLLLHVEQKDIGDEMLAKLFRQAHEAQINVSAWFLLPYDKHLYVGEETVDHTRDLSLKFADWVNKENLEVNAVAFDCEPSPLLGKQLFAAVRHARIDKLANTLKAEQDPDRFQRSIDGLNSIIDELHDRGFRVMGAGNRTFLDFLKHGNTSIQDALNAPFTMVHWDRTSFITYRYLASQAQYVAMIKRYGALANKYFGQQASLDLGLIGDQRNYPEHQERAKLFGGEKQFIKYLDGMTSVYDLQEVVGIALGRNIEYINLYSLEGAVDSVAGLDFWLKAASEAKPLNGWDRWTPFQSLKLSIISGSMNGLFSLFVGEIELNPSTNPYRE